MYTILILMVACIYAACLLIFPELAPPHAWLGVFAAFFAAPIVTWLEWYVDKLDEEAKELRAYQYRTFANIFEDNQEH